MQRVLFGLCALLATTLFGDKAMNPTIIMETTQGNIEIELMPEVAPKACENLMQLAGKGYYDGIIFHRVIKGFMIQGGDPTGSGMGGQSAFGAPFEDEVTAKVRFERGGLLAMANAGPKTNGSQFFITTAATPWLQGKHTIFGRVVSGYDVVQKIENVQTGMMDKPVTAQVIKKMYVKKSKDDAADQLDKKSAAEKPN